MFKKLSYSVQLSIILLIKLFIMIGVILYAGIGLGPDEAQYWTWSQALDWGYYSKPPGIAWQIWLGTQLFGQTELGVRFASLIISAAQSFAVYYLALVSGLRLQTAFWCGLMMAFCPIGMFGSLFAITDGGFLLFWTLASICVAAALNQNRAPNPIQVGIFILGGALFKWPIYIFWAFYFACRFFYFRSQKLSAFIGGVTVSLFGLLPSVWWNWSHDWATFRHVASTIQGGHGANGGNPFDFVGSQILLLSPILFVLLIKAFAEGLSAFRKISPPLILCGGVSLLCLLAMLSASLFQKIQGNWVLFAYPTGIVFLGWYCWECNRKAFLLAKLGLGLSIMLVSVLFLWPSFSGYYRINPFKHNLGWNELNQILTEKGFEGEENFLVSDKYQLSSILSFYGTLKKQAYFINLEGHRKNQFSYWPSLQENEQGKSGYFVWVENAPHLQKNREEKQNFYQIELSKYFENVEFLGLFPLLKEEGQMVKGTLLFKCERCLNVKPDDLPIY
jgi:4-amino-4-deoxy-L-arabinose transferase-like glycosyltransferase